MFRRVTVTASDLEASRRFYSTMLGDRDWGDFELRAGEGVTTGLHVAFATGSRAEVDAIWQRGLDAGHPSDGEPGPRPAYGPTYYGAFLLDPDGNSVEAVHREAVRTDGVVDHVWLRVADLDAAVAHYRSLGLDATEEVPGERWNLWRRGPGGGTLAVVTDGRPLTRNAGIVLDGAA